MRNKYTIEIYKKKGSDEMEQEIVSEGGNHQVLQLFININNYYFKTFYHHFTFRLFFRFQKEMNSIISYIRTTESKAKWTIELFAN